MNGYQIVNTLLENFYSINRDDNELRVVMCPACGNVDVKKTDKKVKYDKYYDLIKYICNRCKCEFAFYEEDGAREISTEEAWTGKDSGDVDLQDDGKDEHGHAPYLILKPGKWPDKKN